MKDEPASYVLTGRSWARGWNRYESMTMNWLIGILALPPILGLALSVFLAVKLSLSWFTAAIVIFIVGLLMLFVGIVLARTIVPFVWDSLLTKDLEN